jgi:flagellin
MGLKINTNLAALNAHSNMQKTDNALSASLERLSSGLRINRAADDASGMAIADSLKSQSMGLGQAIRNANDGISIVQTADGALEESIKIVNTIKSKSIQAAQDGQTTESRQAIQADINRLMEELDTIAKTTSFNGQKLLSGQFTNKKFQIGAFSGETASISIGSAESTKVGHVTTGVLQTNSASGGEVRLSIYSNSQSTNVSIQSVNLAYDNSKANSMGALADAINKVSDLTGVTAQARVEVTSNSAVAAGTTGSDFAINGVTIGSITVQANDANGSLASTINLKSSQTGVIASVDKSGLLTLTSKDGRAIQVTGDTGTTLRGSNLSTFGEIKLFQAGANDIKVTDDADMVSLNLTGSLTSSGNTTTTVDSTLSTGSILASASIIIAGSTLGFTGNAASISGTVTTTQDSSLKAGSVIGSDSTIEQGSILGGSANNASDITTTADSLLKIGSTITSGTILAAGTTITTDINTTTGVISAGTTLGSEVTTSGSNTLTADMLVKKDSVFQSGATFAAGSYVGADIVLSNDMTLTTDMTLKAGSEIIFSGSNTSILGGSTIGGQAITTGTSTVTQGMTLKAGSTIGSGSTLAQGSSLGGRITTSATVTAAGDMTIAAGSQLAAGSILKAGTVLTNDIWVAGGNLLKSGTVLTGDAVTSGTNNLSNAMTLKANSTMASGSVLAAAATSSSGATATTSISDVKKYALSDIDVTTQEGAQVAITITDAALKNLDKSRSDLGSVQNQLTSTISNLTVTKANLSAAESNIRDVDLAEEVQNFSKLQLLAQASSYALAQANSTSQTVLSLLK